MTDDQPQTLMEDLPTRATVRSDSGLEYLEFRKTLKPKWHRVWMHIAFGYFALGLLIVSSVLVWNSAPVIVGIASVPLFGAMFGYAIHYLHLLHSRGRPLQPSPPARPQ